MRHTLDIISPIDGRYHGASKNISELASEKALILYRIRAEIAWLEVISQNDNIDCPEISQNAEELFKQLKAEISIEEAERVKQIEESTRHDVKAVEYYIRERLIAINEPELSRWVHFACTSEDINNTAYALMLTDIKTQILIPDLINLCMILYEMSDKTIDNPMLSWTHGQTASPTTFGKEIAVFLHRVTIKLNQISEYKFSAKINGAVGNFNAHISAYPKLDWQLISKQVTSKLKLNHNDMSTQISNHDNLVEFICLYKHTMLILQDLSQDLWLYVHKNYLKLRKDTDTQVGSSTMPHKINPIHFENAEGNIGIHKALANQLIDKLPISRMQRDLSDSTTLRNIGVCLAHAQIAVTSLAKGLKATDTNAEYMQQELNQHWEVLTEAIQTILKKHGCYNAYEDIKQISQGCQQSETDFRNMVNRLDIPLEVRNDLLTLEPKTYLGLAIKQARESNLRAFSLIKQLISNKH